MILDTYLSEDEVRQKFSYLKDEYDMKKVLKHWEEHKTDYCGCGYLGFNHRAPDIAGVEKLWPELNREKSHGEYYSSSKVKSLILKAIRQSSNWTKLSFSQERSIEMIIEKLVRICCGNANFKDHWDDIIGYAQLALRSIHK